MRFRTRSVHRVACLFLTAGLTMACHSSASDFETFMGTTLPSNVRVTMEGNWGHDPWRCWEIYPANDDLKKKLVATWNLTPDPKAFHGVASGDRVYCKYDDLSESYSGGSDSYRAVGIDARNNKIVVYFYNG